MTNPAQEYGSLVDLLSPQDPKKKLLLAQALQGTDTSPVQHWSQGAARMANAFLGNYGIAQDELEKKQQANSQIRAALADPQLGGSGVVPPPQENPSLISKIAALLGGGGGQPSAQPSPASAVPMGGIIGSPLPQLSGAAGEPSPPPPPMAPGRPSPLPSARAGPVAPVQPQGAFGDRIAGVQDAISGGQFDPQGANATTFGQKPNMVAALGGQPPVAPAPASPPGIVAAPPPPVVPPGSPGAAPASDVAPRRQPTIPAEKATFIRSLLSRPETFTEGMRQKALAEKPEEDQKLRMIEDMRTNPQKFGFKAGSPEQFAAINQVASGITQQTTVNNVANPIVSGVGEDILKQRNAARVSAQETIPQIHEARQALDRGAITGFFAEGKLGLQKIGSLFGVPSAQAENTETLRAAIGTQVLGHAKALGANPSNADRDYIEKVQGGQISLEEGSMRKILDMQEKWSRQAIRNSNAMSSKIIASSPEAYRHVAPAMTIDEPPAYAPPPPTVPAAPGGGSGGYKILGVR